MAEQEQKKDIVVCSQGFFFGDKLAEELAELRRYIIELAAKIDPDEDAPLDEFAQRLFVLNYLIEDVQYKWDREHKLIS